MNSIKKKFIFVLITLIFQFLLIETFMTFFIYHWYKDRSYQDLLDEPLAIISGLKIINRKFQILDIYQGDGFIARTNISKSFIPQFLDIGAGFGNSNNPTNVTNDTRPLTISDQRLEYILRKNIKIQTTLLKPSKYPNLDPVVLSFNKDANLSSNLKAVLDAEQIVPPYIYSTNEKGERVTLPDVKSDRKFVIVGDSVAFGVGVNDFDTSSSHLQRLIGNDAKVVNLGVGGYNAKHIFEVANKSEYAHKENILIYLICENDFFEDSDFSEKKFTKYLEKFQKLKSTKKYHEVVFVFQSYIYRNFPEVVLRTSLWIDSQASFNSARQMFLKAIKTKNIIGIDWTSYIRDLRNFDGTMFAGLDLYFDHVHLSPKGNKKIAELIYSELVRKNLVLK